MNNVLTVIHAMAAEPGMPELLTHARGLYVAPVYSRFALVVGVASGVGALLVKHADGTWSNPAFFTVAGMSVGLQAGATEGALALVLTNQKAINCFRYKTNFSLGADAGLRIANFVHGEPGWSTADVVLWSNSRGLFANLATVGGTDIRYYPDLTNAYYGKPTTAIEAIDSSLSHLHAAALTKLLRGRPGAARQPPQQPPSAVGEAD